MQLLSGALLLASRSVWQPSFSSRTSCCRVPDIKMQILPHLYGLTIFPAPFVSTQAHALVRLCHTLMCTLLRMVQGGVAYIPFN